MAVYARNPAITTARRSNCDLRSALTIDGFRRARVTISAVPTGRLKVGGPKKAVAELIPPIRAAKFDLIAELTGQTREDQAGIDAIEERAALAADIVPPRYLDAWARLQCQRPPYAAEEAWRRAIEDGGHFLDAWGADAETMQWTPGELFNVPRNGRPGGLAWQLKGEHVNALGEHRARLADGRTILRTEIRGPK